MDVEPAEVAFADIRAYVQQAFAPQAEEKGLDFTVGVRPTAFPSGWSPIRSGSSRSCATCCPTRSSSPTTGAVTLRIERAPSGRPT